jgi:hypothetical protein
MSVAFSKCIGRGPYPNHYGLAKKATMSYQAIIRDTRNEELRPIFDVPKEFWTCGNKFWSIIGGNSG